jgi:hypothetical protein
VHSISKGIRRRLSDALVQVRSRPCCGALQEKVGLHLLFWTGFHRLCLAALLYRTGGAAGVLWAPVAGG